MQGAGSVKAEWLDEVRDAIREKVPVPPEKDFELSAKQAEKVIMKKRNWSAPGPDRIVNFWWKRANCLHVGIVRAFQVIAQSDQDVPLWFTEGTELSERILFARGLPQGDALCPKLFTLRMNPVAWKLQASEGYRLSKPTNTKITDLLYVDDLKVYTASEAKLKVVLREVQAAMRDIGLLWNERKCAVVSVKRGCLQELAPGLKIGEQQLT